MLQSIAVLEAVSLCCLMATTVKKVSDNWALMKKETSFSVISTAIFLFHVLRGLN